MKITFLTLFPEFYESFQNTSIINKAIKKKLVNIETVNIRDYSKDKNKRVDDTVVGGGPGLVLQCEPVIKAIKENKTENSRVIFLSSRGITFNQRKARELSSSNKDLIFLCGHYEGIDERVLDYVDEEISIGDYILTGGEIPSLVVADAVIRLLDGVITEESHLLESYENGLLEYPQYALPKEFDGKKIPEILFSVNHKAIDKWRLKESLKITIERRPDLLEKRDLSSEELGLLKEIKNNKVGKWEMDAIYKCQKLNVHDLRMDEKYYRLIENGSKIYELRMNDEKRKLYKVGDIICFLKRPDFNEFFYRRIKGLLYFDTYEQLADSLNVELTGFDSKEELVGTMKEIYKEKMNLYKIVAIELENREK